MTATTHTEKLINSLEKYFTKSEGTIAEKDGVKYRYDHYISKPKFTPYWLRKMFERAAAENGNDHDRQFNYNKKFGFSFDRAVYKGQPDGKIYASKLIILG